MNVIDRILRSEPVAGGVGFVGPDIPLDLLMASGRPFGHLPWADGPTPWADRWLEDAFPFWARSILEQWHAGRFDQVAQVVFSRTDDASQRLFYYVRELQHRTELRGPTPLILDAALVQRDSSRAHTRAAVRECASRLDVTDAMLSAAIPRADRLRSTLATLQAGRCADGPFFERLGRAALFSDASVWLDEARVPDGVALRRVLLAGSVPPDDRLHRAAEDGGASVVGELHVHGLTRAGVPRTASSEDPADHIARQLIADSISPRSFVDRARHIVDAAQAARADGVVLWQTREEEGLAWHVPAQRRALEAANIPALVLPASEWRGTDGALDRIRRFCREDLR